MSLYQQREPTVFSPMAMYEPGHPPSYGYPHSRTHYAPPPSSSSSSSWDPSPEKYHRSGNVRRTSRAPAFKDHHHRWGKQKFSSPPKRSGCSWGKGAGVETEKSRRLVSVRRDRAFYDFTVMTYNVLSQTFWKDEYNSSCPEFARNAEYRESNILEEILSKKPDILCLQELEEKHYKVFSSALVAQGYHEGLYEQRPSWHEDGLAIFFNESSGIKLVAKKSVNLNTAIDKTSRVYKENAPQRFVRNNIALLVMLDLEVLDSDTCTKKRICVANSHIYWNPSFDDVKLLQAKAVLEQMNHFVESNSDEARNVPIVFAADLNSLPDSGVFDFISKGPFGKRSSTDLERFGVAPNLSLPQLASAYHKWNHPNTNFTQTFTGCIDYIWYSPGSLQVTHLLQGLGKHDKSFRESRFALPNAKYSSDHICLMTGFRFNQEPGREEEVEVAAAAAPQRDPVVKPVALPSFHAKKNMYITNTNFPKSQHHRNSRPFRDDPVDYTFFVPYPSSGPASHHHHHHRYSSPPSSGNTMYTTPDDNNMWAYDPMRPPSEPENPKFWAVVPPSPGCALLPGPTHPVTYGNNAYPVPYQKARYHHTKRPVNTSFPVYQ